MNLFEDNALPVADEQQLYTWYVRVIFHDIR